MDSNVLDHVVAVLLVTRQAGEHEDGRVLCSRRPRCHSAERHANVSSTSVIGVV